MTGPGNDVTLIEHLTNPFTRMLTRLPVTATDADHRIIEDAPSPDWTQADGDEEEGE